MDTIGLDLHQRESQLCILTAEGELVAAVALARRLAGILFAMWRDGQDYRAPPRRLEGVDAVA